MVHPALLPPHAQQGRRPREATLMTRKKRIAADGLTWWFATAVASMSYHCRSAPSDNNKLVVLREICDDLPNPRDPR